VVPLGEGAPSSGVATSSPSPERIPFYQLPTLPDFRQWGPVETEPLRSIRRKIAYKMTTSLVAVPHVAHIDQADVTRLEHLRQKLKAKRSEAPQEHLTLLAFILKAITAGLRDFPMFNASLDPSREEIIFKKYYHLGIAADSGRGLVVPVIKDCDRKSIRELAQEIQRLAQRAREGTLEVDQLQGGTFTISNIGPLGGLAPIPAINYPEVAILGMGRVQPMAVVRRGKIVIRQMCPLSLAFDHRVADGADAARFITTLIERLADPQRLLLEM
jgi:pyruvate dehydrogenase E2 component (dihydrolipoamide acetyltransferase)